MGVPLLDLKAQYESIKESIDEAVAEVMSTARFIGGPKVEELAAAIAEYCGVSHAIPCGNGTDALFLILASMGIGKGDEVITTPFTFFATAESIAHVGATPVFVDIEPDTYNMDVSQVEAAITERTAAIMPVHIFGQPVDMDPLNEVAERHGLAVIEDACQAIGARYKGRRTGSLGDAAAFSFFPSKNLGCAGDGGIIVTDDEALAAKARKKANHGTSKKYFHDDMGVNSRLDALQAAILLAKLPHLDDWNAARRRAAAVYDELLADTGLCLPVVRDFAESVYHLYVVRSARRAEVMQALKDAGIGTAIYYPLSLHLQEVFRYLGYEPGQLPNSEAAQDEAFAIPLFPEITREQQEEVVSVIRSVVM
ncbi:MAG: DegT/DnrJ/EryC1/StrS family aminotransferase [Coriobacteriia bacterium]